MKFFKKLVGDNIYLSPRNVDEEVIQKCTEWLNDFETTDYVPSEKVKEYSDALRDKVSGANTNLK